MISKLGILPVVPIVLLGGLGLVVPQRCSAELAWDPRIVQLGGDSARGCLVEYYPGQSGGPVVVVTHGFNPFPRLVRFSWLRSYADAIHARSGSHVRVLGWDWNMATRTGLRPSRNLRNAQRQGERLGELLLREGIDPGCIHLIGHSLGAVVVSAAARRMADVRGPVRQVTLLDPLRSNHSLIFDRLRVTSAAAVVDHYWTPRPTGFGMDSGRADVADYCVRRASTRGGRINPLRSNHVYVLQWYLATIWARSSAGGSPGAD